MAITGAGWSNPAWGAHLLNTSMGRDIEVTYWRDRNQEVDFVLRQGRRLVALEVKSGRGKDSLPGMDAFARQFKPKRKLLVGGQGIPLDEFLSKPAAMVMTLALTASATMVSYSVGDSGPTSYPGPVTPPAGAPHSVDGWGYPGDTVTLQAGSGSINLADGATGTMNIGTLAWGVAYTYGGTATSWAEADWADLTFTINALRSITIGTATGNISQAGTLESTWNDDFLSFSAGPMASLFVQDGAQLYRVDITPNSLPVSDVFNFDGSVDPPPAESEMRPLRRGMFRCSRKASGGGHHARR